jgi:hypothetical protein
LGRTPDFWHRPGTGKGPPKQALIEAPTEHRTPLMPFGLAHGGADAFNPSG